MASQCPICGSTVPDYSTSQRPTRVECEVCGTYRIGEYALQRLGELGYFPDPNPEHTYSWQGAIRERYESDVDLVVRDLEQLDSLVSVREDPLESIDRILMHVYRKSASADEYFDFDKQTDYPVAYARGAEELTFFLRKAEELGYLEGRTRGGGESGKLTGKDKVYRLELEGWERVSHLRSKGRNSDQAFVAMWFGDEMEGIFERGMQPALEATGYRAFRIDVSEHNEKIDDRIIAEIRKSGLLVADFTGQRGGVYFEAGFAMGLGIPIIWTCHEDDIDNLHFDTRQYNHIGWSDPADLEEQLRLRIEATVPRQSADLGGR